MTITQLDHLVLTVRDILVSCDFYTRFLGMHLVAFAGGRKALKVGTQKINLHEFHNEFEPKAALPTPDSADLCFLTEVPVSEVAVHLERNQIEIIEGPVERTGAERGILSINLRDPDGNLLEIGNRL